MVHSMQYECYINLADGVMLAAINCRLHIKKHWQQKGGIEAAKQQTLDEALKELLALADEGDRGYSAEDDDDDDDSLCTPKRLLPNKERNSTSETNEQCIQFIIWLVR